MDLIISRIKEKVESELAICIKDLDKIYHLSKISPILYKYIKKFILQEGKRIRPILFILGYLSFTDNIKTGMYKTAISLELLHNFTLIHDDIIDRSDIRRQKLSMHAMFKQYIARYKYEKKRFTDTNLAIMAGDIIYAFGISYFLSIKENDTKLKEYAFKKLINSAINTGKGEFFELLLNIGNIDKIKKTNIYKVYDLKTGIYTFATPLSIGAIFAGATNNDINKLFRYGIYIGRAFQIKDDIMDILEVKTTTKKPIFSDIKQSKMTILMWHIYNNSNQKDKNFIRKILSKKILDDFDIVKIHKIILYSDTLQFAKKQINLYLNKALSIIDEDDLYLEHKYKQILKNYSIDILNI